MPAEDRRKNPPSLTEEQLKLISYETTRAARKVLHRYTRSALIGFFILLAGVGFALSQTAGLNDLEKRDVRLCERLNIVRAQSNVSDSVSFAILSNSGRREFALAKGDPDNAKLHADSAEELFAQAQKLTVIDLTDCQKALDPKYDYPLAGPIGNPRTGEYAPGVQAVLDKSVELQRQAHKDNRG